LKIKEIVCDFHCYVVAVRIKRGKTTSTAKTIIYAENTTQARNLLSAIYGENSVVSITKIFESDLNETVPNGTNPRLAPKPIPRILPTDYTHALAQKALFNQMMS
jgi:hypothetical protein